MHDFTRTVPFEEEPIETQRQRLTRIDREALIRFYRSSLHADMLTWGKPPRAPYMRQLLRDWQEIAEREQAAEESVLLSTIPLFTIGNLTGSRDIPDLVDTSAQHV